MTPPVHAIDIAIVAIYVLLTVWIGLRHWRQSASGAEEYILAGRGLTLPAFVMTLVTTWYGGILGVGEYTYRYGLANWFVFGLPYYVAAALFALFFAARAQHTHFRNLPDQLGRAYGPRVARAGALVVLLMALPAGYVLMLGALGVTILGVDLKVAVVVGTLASVAYVYFGGFRSVLRTDALQFLLMYGGFIMFLVLLWQAAGSPAEMWARLPAAHREPTGGQSVWEIIVWYFIALATMIDPAFYQRCYAARDPATARRGVLISIGCWLLFDLLTTTTGLYAVVLYPNLPDPVSSYPQLAADYLVPGLRGLFWVTLLAIVMSTVESYTFVSAVTLGRDVWLGGAHRGGDAAELRASRLALPAVAILAMVFALFFRSVVDIWYVFGTLGTSALLLPVLLSFSERWRFSPRGALANILLAGGMSLAWEIARERLGADRFPLAVPAIYPGLLVSVVILIFSGRRGCRRTSAAPAAGP